MRGLLILSSFCIGCFAESQNDPRIDEILTYWFGDLKSSEDYPQERSKIWFVADATIDQEIRERFEHLVLDAANHKLNTWRETPRGCLALILLVDQFPRNIYRGTAKAFAFDLLAQELTLEGLDLGRDRALFPIERVFFYLPLEHAENLQLQELSIAKFSELVACVPLSLTPIFADYLEYAWRHYVIIEKFGRFPHRNTILGRESTPEELEFIRSKG